MRLIWMIQSSTHISWLCNIWSSAESNPVKHIFFHRFSWPNCLEILSINKKLLSMTWVKNWQYYWRNKSKIFINLRSLQSNKFTIEYYRFLDKLKDGRKKLISSRSSFLCFQLMPITIGTQLSSISNISLKKIWMIIAWG